VIEGANDNDDLGYDNFVLGNQVLSAVPEPEIASLLFGGFGLLGFLARRRRVSTN
jgi:PEP-CTERM motif-containing protein